MNQNRSQQNYGHNNSKHNNSLAPGLTINASGLPAVRDKCVALLAMYSAKRLAAKGDPSSSSSSASTAAAMPSSSSNSSRFAEQQKLAERYAAMSRPPRAGIGAETLTAEAREAQLGISEEKRRQDVLGASAPTDDVDANGGENSEGRAAAAQHFIEEFSDTKDRKAIARMLPKQFLRGNNQNGSIGSAVGSAAERQQRQNQEDEEQDNDADEALSMKRESGKVRPRSATATATTDAPPQPPAAPAAGANTTSAVTTVAVAPATTAASKKKLAPDPRMMMLSALAPGGKKGKKK